MIWFSTLPLKLNMDVNKCSTWISEGKKNIDRGYWYFPLSCLELLMGKGFCWCAPPQDAIAFRRRLYVESWLLFGRGVVRPVFGSFNFEWLDCGFGTVLSLTNNGVIGVGPVVPLPCVSSLFPPSSLSYFVGENNLRLEKKNVLDARIKPICWVSI